MAPISTETVTAWARGGRAATLAGKASDEGGGRGPVDIDQAMESVLEETLRRNRKLEADLARALDVAHAAAAGGGRASPNGVGNRK